MNLKAKKINLNYIKKILPKRTKLSNKTLAGKVLVIGGGKGLYGAGILSALAATRSGAGYTHLMSDLSKFPWMKFPDFIVHPLEISELKEKHDYTIAIGPGLGIKEKNKSLIKYLLKNNFEKVLLDADALTLITTMKIKRLPPSWILTPHEGELARLLNIPAIKIKKDRSFYIQQAQKKYGCVILLKGHETLIIDTENIIYKVSIGTPALAKAGTGDVLLGIIAAMRAQNMNPLDSCILASYIHGMTSQTWKKRKLDDLSMRPMDIIEMLPKTLFQIRRQIAEPNVLRR